ncbi:hypothetical protein MKW98_004379 [Papaver atlanticum]|uniref:Uncharacterized protein n=1 Tax=Papaver atlanticum TaxID=357466 RepID=A0AAD4SN23_9MAGN|nr:hypothetical protein MKW98_004379 [Papaver atlanticum]
MNRVKNKSSSDDHRERLKMLEVLYSAIGATTNMSRRSIFGTTFVDDAVCAIGETGCNCDARDHSGWSDNVTDSSSIFGKSRQGVLERRLKRRT